MQAMQRVTWLLVTLTLTLTLTLRMHAARYIGSM